MRGLAAAAVLVGACTLPASSPVDPNGAPPSAVGDSATLVRVDDGDSITVVLDGREERVRLIGINAPEQGECLSDAARARLDELVSDTEMTLISDRDDRDRFDRLLRYVFVGDVHVNAALASEGLVLARPFEPNTTRQDELEAAEDAARSAGRGMWDPAACGAFDAAVVVVDVLADPPGPDLEGEFVEIRNDGPDLDLTGWAVRDETSQNRFEFPPGTQLPHGASVRIFSGCGNDEPTVVFWCSSTPVWDNSGDTAFLVSPTGSIHSSYSYGG